MNKIFITFIIGLSGLAIFYILLHQYENYRVIWQWEDFFDHEFFVFLIMLGIFLLIIHQLIKNKGMVKKGYRT